MRFCWRWSVRVRGGNKMAMHRFGWLSVTWQAAWVAVLPLIHLPLPTFHEHATAHGGLARRGFVRHIDSCHHDELHSTSRFHFHWLPIEQMPESMGEDCPVELSATLTSAVHPQAALDLNHQSSHPSSSMMILWSVAQSTDSVVDSTHLTGCCNFLSTYAMKRAPLEMLGNLRC